MASEVRGQNESTRCGTGWWCGESQIVRRRAALHHTCCTYQKPSAAVQVSSRFLSMIFLQLRSRREPQQSMAKPACMKNTSEAAAGGLWGGVVGVVS